MIPYGVGGQTWVGFGTGGTAGTAGARPNFNGNHLDFVTPLTASGGGGQMQRVYDGVLSNEDAWNLDTKMDDGIAYSGKLRADIVKYQNTGTLTNMTCLTYDLTNTTNTCAMAYIFGQ